MQLRELKLTSFKNHSFKSFEFERDIVAFCGKNGVGKTNILDAIYLLCMCKSYFNSVENNNITHEDPFYSVFGRLENDEVACMVKRGQGKTFRFNKKEYDRLSEHIGKMPVVMIAPGDIALVYEGSEERRRFMDALISQADHEYLAALQVYQRALEQRNRLLKQFNETGYADTSVLEAINRQMIIPAGVIFEKRKTFASEFLPYFHLHHGNLTEQAEASEVIYTSPLFDEPMQTLLRANENRDMDLGRTEKGPHRDDLEFVLKGYPLKKFGSQGQIKSFLIALKLAQFDYLNDKTGRKPFLLLDDIFEKLDEFRAGRLMEMVAREHFGQIFITDTHRKRIETIFEGIGIQPQIIEL